MKDQLLYNTRLLLFAQHISLINDHPEHGVISTYNIVELDSNVRLHYEIRCHDYIFWELCMLFNDSWSLNSNLDPILVDMDVNESTVAAVTDFFQLSPRELCFCFDVSGGQDTIYYGGGNVLNEDSIGMHIAQNILLVVQKRRKDNSK
ncbi:MAG: hypothetical protein JWO09_132 [Bacteroidetes bacterium]|nr:hypothetical protein [Bacteroidota bacterium]